MISKETDELFSSGKLGFLDRKKKKKTEAMKLGKNK